MMDCTYDVLHRPFDISTHKKTFINYLEVVIDVDGVVHYAVPSHQEYLVQQIVNTTGKTRDEVLDMYRYSINYMEELCRDTDAVLVWDNYLVGIPNTLQIGTLNELRQQGLYRGPIPNLI